jgi:hypothetical protein
VRFGRKRNSTTQWDERRPESRFWIKRHHNEPGD